MSNNTIVAINGEISVFMHIHAKNAGKNGVDLAHKSKISSVMIFHHF